MLRFAVADYYTLSLFLQIGIQQNEAHLLLCIELVMILRILLSLLWLFVALVWQWTSICTLYSVRFFYLLLLSAEFEGYFLFCFFLVTDLNRGRVVPLSLDITRLFICILCGLSHFTLFVLHDLPL